MLKLTTQPKWVHRAENGMQAAIRFTVGSDELGPSSDRRLTGVSSTSYAARSVSAAPQEADHQEDEHDKDHDDEKCLHGEPCAQRRPDHAVNAGGCCPSPTPGGYDVQRERLCGDDRLGSGIERQ